MLKAPNEEEAFAVLFDTDLADLAQKEKDIEKIAKGDILELKKKLSSILQEDPLVQELLFLKFDALHLKQILAKEQNPIIFEQANLPFVFLEEFCNKPASADSLAAKMAERTAVKENATLKEINEAVDGAYFAVKLEACRKHPLFTQYVRLEIDLANLKAVLADKEEKDFIRGGNFDHNELLKLAKQKEGETMVKGVKRFLEAYDISLILEGEHSEILLEAKLKAYLSQIAKREERESGSGVAKVLSFFEKKLNALNNIKLILFSKRAGLVPDEIEPLLLPL